MAARRGRSQARRSGNRGVPGWVLALGVGLALGIGLSAIFLLREGFDPSRLLPTPNPTALAPREPEPAVAQAMKPARRASRSTISTPCWPRKKS